MIINKKNNIKILIIFFKLKKIKILKKRLIIKVKEMKTLLLNKNIWKKIIAVKNKKT
jgi:hypothetical protein